MIGCLDDKCVFLFGGRTSNFVLDDAVEINVKTRTINMVFIKACNWNNMHNCLSVCLLLLFSVFVCLFYVRNLIAILCYCLYMILSAHCRADGAAAAPVAMAAPL